MEMEKDQQPSTEQKLLENDNQDHSKGEAPNLLNCEAGSVASLFQELLLVLSCCYLDNRCFFQLGCGLLVKSSLLWGFLSGVEGIEKGCCFLAASPFAF
ncbi:unnamed protein product [Sphenostylis stenocarpa]|uniref:Uncharacterized protein n=1 Tax=Sphenostylis stenocarpa TaxID=92480 RepID=A0AA86VY43_9FABA|nr:unnamed protein product [Sphenostylis stenocarpa]